MTSSALAIAKKDFADAARSRLLIGLVAFLLFVSVTSISNSVGGPRTTLYLATRSITSQNGIYVPIIAMLVAYRSVVGERESGSLRVLLGLPGTRRDVVLGKLLGRSAVVVVALLVLGLGSGVAVFVGFGDVELGYAFLLVGLVALYGLAWTGFAVGVSAAVASRFSAVVAMFGAYFVTSPSIWNGYVLQVFALLFEGETMSVGLIPGGQADLEPIVVAQGPTWYLYVQRLNPVYDFDLASSWLHGVVDPSLPDLFGLAMLTVWFAVPVALGYWRFERADLG